MRVTKVFIRRCQPGSYTHRVHILVETRDETGLVYLPSQLERIHCNQVRDGKQNKGGGRAPPPSPAQPNFTLMTECTPESRRYYSVYSVGYTHKVHILVEMEQGECICPLSWSVYTGTWYVMVNAKFSIMMVCAPESGGCHSACTLWLHAHPTSISPGGFPFARVTTTSKSCLFLFLSPGSFEYQANFGKFLKRWSDWCPTVILGKTLSIFQWDQEQK